MSIWFWIALWCVTGVMARLIGDYIFKEGFFSRSGHYTVGDCLYELCGAALFGGIIVALTLIIVMIEEGKLPSLRKILSYNLKDII